jgi:hypothetical protein
MIRFVVHLFSGLLGLFLLSFNRVSVVLDPGWIPALLAS